MSRPVRDRPRVNPEAPDNRADVLGAREPLPGRQALLLAALLIGLVLMGLQLWLLTVALDMYLAGEGESLWLLALVSGLVFAGGLLAWRRSA